MYFPGKLQPELVLLQLGRPERRLVDSEVVAITEVNGRSPDIKCE